MENKIPESTLKAFRDGSQEAYKEIYLRYKGPVESFIYKIIRSREVAEEITQDMFINVWEKRATIDPAKGIKSYLFTIAKNMALNHIEKEKVRGKYNNLIKYDIYRLPAESDELIIAKEAELLTQIAIARMPEMRGKVFSYSHYEGLSNEEIAQKLKINKATVATHLSHARKELKNIFMLCLLMFYM